DYYCQSYDTRLRAWVF
nr:immunoglobulin light chain junction region [Macaca mulatta]MOV72409.1 immunoglobulin light chain junction region [Macaca mulatta]MOV72625.1 immunoglobulin light chain junction region [Macaca mulatta]MOV72813.1 immunoglobulin light chain junction region [Macaca mulatta]MOV72851.1 immunoglobulin light chain junction region [Macaca mulatta]